MPTCLVDLVCLSIYLVPALKAGGVEVLLHRFQLVAARLSQLLAAPAGRDPDRQGPSAGHPWNPQLAATRVGYMRLAPVSQ